MVVHEVSEIADHSSYARGLRTPRFLEPTQTLGTSLLYSSCRLVNFLCRFIFFHLTLFIVNGVQVY